MFHKNTMQSKKSATVENKDEDLNGKQPNFFMGGGW
jgi:hypothetical protein